MALREQIIRVLDEAQSGLHHHQRLLKALRELLDKHTADDFFEAFFAPFSNVLLVYKREPAVKRVVDFVAKFTALAMPENQKMEDEEEEEEEEEEEDSNNSFSTMLLKKLLSLNNARDKAVRFRVCQIVNKTLNYAAEMNRTADDELLEIIQGIMLERAFDKIPLVRVEAVSALGPLQEEVNPHCPIVKALLWLLRRDSSPDVRLCALNKIVIANSTLPAVIERTHDVKDTVRRSAFLCIADKCSIRHLSIQQRIQLLEDGLKDQSKAVVDACVNGLLRSWSLSLGEDFLALLARLHVESSPKVAELALQKLFDGLALEELASSMVALINTAEDGDTIKVEEGEEEARGRLDKEGPGESHQRKVIPFGLLRCEEAFYWSCLCRYFHSKGVEGIDALEQVLPTLSEFCDYVKSYVEDVVVPQRGKEEESQTQFVAEQLFSIFPSMDLSDEVGRRRLGGMVCGFLVMPEFPVALTEALLSMQKIIWPQETFRVEKLTEVIADLRQPPNEVTLQSTTLASEGESVLGLSFLDLKEDPDTLFRCLAITCALVRGLDIKKEGRLSPTLRTLTDSLILPCVQKENPFVRDMAVNCLGLVCLLDITMARKLLLLFLQVSQVDHELVQATALKVVFDLLHMFGFEAFNLGEREGKGDSPQIDEDSISVNTTEVGVASDDPGSDSGLSTEEEQEEEGEEEKKTDKTTQRILNIMVAFLEGESPLLREVSGEGIAKLLLSGRVLSAKLLAKLLLLWYNPTTEGEDHLRHTLGVFFPTFSAMNKGCRECLGEVYMPVMKAVLEAPPTSPLASIDVNNLTDFIVQLSAPTKPNEDSVHDSLSHDIANAILADPADSIAVRSYSRTLSQLKLTTSNQTMAQELQVLLEQMQLNVSDRTSLRYLSKFGAVLKKINPSTPKAVPSTDSEEEDEDEENLNPVPTCTRRTIARASKSIAVKVIHDSAVQALDFTGGEDSDDSIVGEHSPFIRHTATRSKRRTSEPLKTLQLDED